MKELQKYYECGKESCETCTPMYAASEADAAFAEMRREHAEEIERLKAAIDSSNAAMHILQDQRDEFSLQAERYEKLRKLSPAEYSGIRNASFRSEGPMMRAFDALVDQLPASGEASAEEPECVHGHGKSVYTNAGRVDVCSNCGESVKR